MSYTASPSLDTITMSQLAETIVVSETATADLQTITMIDYAASVLATGVFTADSTINPIKVTGITSSKATILAQGVTIRHLIWYKPTTVGHLLSLVDDDDNPIWKSYADAANKSQKFMNLNMQFDEIYCDDMDSGELYVYLA